MIWTAWRQQRSILVAATAVLVVLVLALLVTGHHQQAIWAQLSRAACRGQASSNGKLSAHCTALVSEELSAAHLNDAIAAVAIVLGPLLGAIMGANAVAREIEVGTARLAWTQSVSRARWLLTKVVVGFMALGLFLLPLLVVLPWWVRATHYGPRLGAVAFELAGLSGLFNTLFAFALVVALGLLIRRAGWTLAVAVVVLLAVFVAMNGSVRLRLAEQRLGEAPSVVYADGLYGNVGVYASGLTLTSGVSERGLTTPPTTATFERDAQRLDHCDNEHRAIKNSYERCMKRLDYVLYVVYVPDRDFWTLQLLEGTLYVAGTVLLVGASVAGVRRVLV